MTVASIQMPDMGSFGADYPRLLLALRDAAPGDLVFVQISSPVQRHRLPEQLAADGLQRPFAVADFATFHPSPPPYGVLRQFLEDLEPAPPEILFVDGLEHWIDSDPKPGGALEALNLGRERLASLGVVVVFLLPTYLIDLIRTRALNLWTWRAHHYSLEPTEVATERDSMTQSLDTGRSIALGDTPESRDRRIRILQRLLDEGLAENHTLDSLTHPVLLPLARELYNAGRFAEALSILDRVKDSLEKAEDSLDTSVILNLRALVLHALGNFNEAELLYKRSLATGEKTLGPEHLNVATIFNNLAGLYSDQDKYAQAEPLYRRALAIREKALGPDHPNVATILNNLAGLYHTQGRSAEAEPLYRRALAIREKALGPEHSDVANSLNNLAGLYKIQGKYAEAELLYERSLTIREKALGPEHPDVANSLNNLARFYESQGRHVEAEPLLQRALAVLEKGMRPDHPNVATILENYAALLRKMNRETEAADMEARAKAIRAKYAQENPTK